MALYLRQANIELPPRCSNRPLMKPNYSYCIKVCNDLLQSELSAVETYHQAIEKYAGATVTEELRRICLDHARAAAQLAVRVQDMGGEPERTAGAWGNFATSVCSTENLYGEESAIEWLQRGEEMARKHYQNALLDDDVVTDTKGIIREELLPSVIHHIASLERLEEAV
jgi:uncharacterized protein (TIGR02284 family)